MPTRLSKHDAALTQGGGVREQGRAANANSLHASAPARIGPNAIIRLGEALRAAHGASLEEAVFLSAGLAGYLKEPPGQMVPEADVLALHTALRARLPLAQVRAVSWQAGLLTGDYLLAHRIPRTAQAVLQIMPRRLAARALLAAISRHAWTFAGSGIFRASATPALRIELDDCPLCRDVAAHEPVCDYFAGTFTRIWSALIDPDVKVLETRCGAVSPGGCVFEAVRVGGPRPVQPPGHG